MKRYEEFRSANLEIWNKVKEIIDPWDPIDLLKYGAPSDEYDYEIFQIVTAIQARANIDQLSVAVYEVFLRSFGPGVFRQDRQLFIESVKGLFSGLY